MKKLLFGAFALALFAGVGCKKDKNEDVCALTSASFAGSYKVTGFTLQIGSSGETDIYNTSAFESCKKDDVYTFKIDSTYTVTDAGEVCSPSSSGSGTWTLTDNVLTSNIPYGSGTVSEFNCSGFVVSKIDGTNTYRLKFTRQ